MFTGDAKLRKLSREERREITLKNGRWGFFFVLRDDLTPAEIAEAKELDETHIEVDGLPIVANFLPDDERPADVPAY